MGWLDRMLNGMGRAGGVGSGSAVGGAKAGEGRSADRSPAERQLLDRLRAGDADPLVRLALRFTGMVQGVGFRWTNQQLASARRLTGWVRNMDDGSVTMEVQGAPAAIADHLDAVHANYRRFGNKVWLASWEDLPSIPAEADFEVRF